MRFNFSPSFSSYFFFHVRNVAEASKKMRYLNIYFQVACLIIKIKLIFMRVNWLLLLALPDIIIFASFSFFYQKRLHFREFPLGVNESALKWLLQCFCQLECKAHMPIKIPSMLSRIIQFLHHCNLNNKR